MNSVNQALDSETPHLQAYFTKIEILLALKDGKAALEYIDELAQVNEKRWEEKRALKNKVSETEAALARDDESSAHDLMQALMAQVAESGLPAETLGDDKENHFGVELVRAEAYQILQDWGAAGCVYQGMLMSMETPNDGTPAQQRRAFMGISRCAYEQGVYDKAIYGAEVALEMNRHFPGIHKLLALSQKANGDMDAAITTMNRGVLYETPWDEDNKAEVLKLYNELRAEKSAKETTS
jgi:tetratricopeptide (TPR) repeat protein